jgi:hypothetical protein
LKELVFIYFESNEKRSIDTLIKDDPLTCRENAAHFWVVKRQKGA